MSVAFEYYDTKKRGVGRPWEFYMNSDTDPSIIFIYCLTLATRPDRRRNAECVFGKYRIPVNWAVATPHPAGGLNGCFDSHIAIINDALDKGAKHLLIFEDDAKPTCFFKNSVVRKATSFMGKCEYDVFFFGPSANIIHARTRFLNRHIYSLKSKGGFAYGMSRPFMENIKSLKFIGNGLDLIIENNDKSYSVHPMQFGHRDSGSTNSCDRSCVDYRKFVPSQFCGRASELYFYSKWLYSVYVNIPLRYVNLIAILALTCTGIYVISKRACRAGARTPVAVMIGALVAIVAIALNIAMA
jgi:glycosyl transferase family 25